jgi:hypothetical protein
MVCLTDGGFAGWSGEPPFTDSTPVSSAILPGQGSVGVAGWNASAAGSDVSGWMPGGLGTLLGPEETPVWCCSRRHPW